MADAPEVERPPCVNCGVELAGRHCHLCGEKVIGPGDRSLRHYLGGLIEATLNVEGKLLKTLWALVRRPGLLTAEYWRGRRVPYMKPLHLFLLVNLAYFFLAKWEGLSAVPFRFFLYEPANVALLERKLGIAEADRAELRRAAAEQRDSKAPAASGPAKALKDYGKKYDATAPTLSHSLIVIVVGMLTAPLALIQARRRRRFPLVAHLVFATHAMTFFLLVFLANEWLWRLLRWALGGHAWFHEVAGRQSPYPLLTFLVPMLLYFYLALRRFYEEGRAIAAGKAVLLTIAIWYVLLTYQKLLFYVTLLFT